MSFIYFTQISLPHSAELLIIITQLSILFQWQFRNDKGSIWSNIFNQQKICTTPQNTIVLLHIFIKQSSLPEDF